MKLWLRDRKFRSRLHANYNYIFNISHRYNFLYVETAKVACSTIKRTLQLLEVGSSNRPIPDDVHAKSESPLSSPNLDFREFLSQLKRGDLFVFSFVRNPYTRVLSAYIEKMTVDMDEKRRLLPELGIDVKDKADEFDISFLDFLRHVRQQNPCKMDIHWAPQSALMAVDVIEYDFIGRFENLEQDLAGLLDSIAPKQNSSISAVRPHKTNSNDLLKEFYGPLESQLVREIYEKDFEEFGYSDSLPKGQLEVG